MTENRAPGRRLVTAGLYWKTAFFARTRPLWRALARLESTIVGDLIAEHPVEAPVFIAGVPRTGTTISRTFTRLTGGTGWPTAWVPANPNRSSARTGTAS